MKGRLMWALLGLNVVLLLALVAQLAIEPAMAQDATEPFAQARRPADYVMVPGEVIGGQSAVVYVIDTSNGLLSAISYDQSRNELQSMEPIDLARVFDGGPPVPPAGGRR
jgi:hypothetical protein